MRPENIIRFALVHVHRSTADDERNRISGASFHPFSGFLPFASPRGDADSLSILIFLQRADFTDS